MAEEEVTVDSVVETEAEVVIDHSVEEEEVNKHQLKKPKLDLAQTALTIY